ncbi:MAG TPA: hypothetical protein VIL09_11000 [Microvirga sp.]
MRMVSSQKVLAGALAAAVFTAGLGLSNEAEARPRNRGAAIAAGVIGGLALGALAASAARPAYAYPSYGYGHGGYGYAPAYGGYSYGGYQGGYHPASSYYAPAYQAYPRVDAYYGAYDPGPVCYWQRRRVAIDPYTVVVRRVQVCE